MSIKDLDIAKEMLQNWIAEGKEDEEMEDLLWNEYKNGNILKSWYDTVFNK